MDEVEYNHWLYRIEALTREVQFIHDTVNMASAYRNKTKAEDLLKHQADLDMARYLLEEARYKVEVEDARRKEAANVVVPEPS